MYKEKRFLNIPVRVWGWIAIVVILLLSIKPNSKTNTEAANSSNTLDTVPYVERNGKDYKPDDDTVMVNRMTRPKPKPTIYRAQDLNYTYQQNEVSADQSFKGARILVVGRVTSINKNFADEIYVTLSTGEWLQDIHCEGISENIAANLSKGQKIVVEGTCKGLMMGSVILENCVVQ